MVARTVYLGGQHDAAPCSQEEVHSPVSAAPALRYPTSQGSLSSFSFGSKLRGQEAHGKLGFEDIHTGDQAGPVSKQGYFTSMLSGMRTNRTRMDGS